jgi:hypothetical protein
MLADWREDMKICLSVLWLLFAALFLYLGLWHLQESEVEIPSFKIADRPFQGSESNFTAGMNVAGVPIDEPLRRFVDDFNEYLKQLNAASCSVNRRASLGYLLSCLTAIAAMVLEWRENISRRKKERQRKHGGQQSVPSVSVNLAEDDTASRKPQS